MTTFTAMNAKIGSVGGKELLSELGAIDKKVETTASKMKAALAATGNDLGAAARMIVAEANQANVAVAEIATTATKSFTATATAIESAGNRISHSAMIGIGELTRGLGRIGSTGQLSAFAVRELAGGVMRLGASLGAVGGLAGMAVLAGGAIVEAFTKARKELEKTQIEFNQRLDEMAKSSSLAGLGGRFGIATEIQSGDPFAKILGRNPGEKDLDFIRRSQGIVGLQSEVARRQAAVDGQRGLFRGGSREADALREAQVMLKAEIEKHTKTERLIAEVNKKVVDETTTGIREAAERKSIKALFNPESPTGNGVFGDRLKGMLAGTRVQQIGETPREAELETYKQILAKEYQEAKTLDEKDAILNKIKRVLEEIDKLNPRLFASVTGDGVKAAKLPALSAAEEDAKATVKRMTKFADDAAQHIASTFGSTIAAGFTAAFAPGGNSKSIFKAMTSSILEGLGSMFEQIGVASLVGLEFIQGIKAAIFAFAPEVGLVAAIGLIAFGAALKGAGSRIGSSGSGGASGGGYTGASVTPITSIGYINPVAPAGSSASASSIGAQQPVHFTIIGKDDPAAQRQILELMARANRRGSTSG